MKKPIICVFLILLLFSSCKKAGPSGPVISPTPTLVPAFWKTYGGGEGATGRAILNAPGNGYMAVGSMTSLATSSDFYLIRLDSAGDCVWAKTYGGISADTPVSAIGTSDGGCIIYGQTGAPPWCDGYLVKVNSSGGLEWQQTYGDLGYGSITSVRPTSDGNLILAGYINSGGPDYYDFYLIKADASGNCVWSRTFGGPGAEYAYAVRQTADNGYLIAGTTDSSGAGGIDFYVVKTDASGNSLWANTYGGALDDYCYDIADTGDGGFVLVGSTNSFGAGGSDAYFVKIDSSGNALWTRTYGGSGADSIQSIIRTSDGGYAAIGSTTSYGTGGTDMFLIKLDSGCNVTDYKTYGGAGDDTGFSVVQTADGGYAMIGGTDSFGTGASSMYVVKVDKNGNNAW